MERYPLESICASLTYALGIEAPSEAQPKNPKLCEYVDSVFGGERADRVLMYNPDAIAQWIYEKYGELCLGAKKNADIEIPLCAVMPSVTPVCFGTMYTGASPAVHGIRRYEKPIIRIDTIFDALIRAGKRVALITYSVCSLSKIYLERDIDYFNYPDGGIEDVLAKAAELIVRDEHDVIIIYNGNYDSVMHKTGPESTAALAELRVNASAFATLSGMVKNLWGTHNTLVGFAMDHGCHEIDDGSGSHGLDMDEDLHIVHLYKGYKRSNK